MTTVTSAHSVVEPSRRSKSIAGAVIIVYAVLSMAPLVWILLTAFKSPLVVPKACNLLKDKVWQVRTTAIAALTKIRSKDAVEPLVDRIQVEEGRLVPEIAEALANLTGKELGGDAEKWKQWWAENKATFVLPSAEAIAYLRGKHETRTGLGGSNWTKSGVKDYHGISTPSRSIMFVIDVWRYE